MGAVSTLALATALLAFGASLRHFVDTPRLYGSDWNASIDASLSNASPSEDHAQQVIDQVSASLAGNHDVEAFSLVRVSELDIAGRQIPALAMERSARSIDPTITRGRAPAAAGEVVLGRSTAKQLGVGIGDRTTVVDPDGGRHRVLVVGEAVLPEVGTYPGSDKTSLGEGVLLSPDGLHQLASHFDKQFFVARLRPGADITRLEAALPALQGGDILIVTSARLPADVENLNKLRSTPTLLVGLLAVLLGAAVTHALLVAFRARRHDIAVLRSMGYRPRQVVSTSLWQATTTAVIAAVIGIPVGLVAGRAIWTALAQGIGTLTRPVTPLVGLVLIALVVLALANLVAVVPGVRAARRSPAEDLRTE